VLAIVLEVQELRQVQEPLVGVEVVALVRLERQLLALRLA
jgi:hypothetical protein